MDSIHSIVWTRCHRSIKSRILHKNQDTFPSSSEQNRGSCHLWFSMLGPKNMGKYQLRELGSDAFPIGYILETNHGGSTGPHPRHVNHVVFCSQRWCGNFQETPSDSWCHVVKPKVEEIVSQVPAKRMSPSNFFKTSFQPQTSQLWRSVTSAQPAWFPMSIAAAACSVMWASFQPTWALAGNALQATGRFLWHRGNHLDGNLTWFKRGKWCEIMGLCCVYRVFRILTLRQTWIGMDSRDSHAVLSWIGMIRHFQE